MADGIMATGEAQYAEGAFSQVVCREGVWWHWRYLPTLGGWATVTGHDPQPTQRQVDVAATRARVELAAQLGGAR